MNLRLMPLFTLLACSDYQIKEQDPNLEVSADGLDFDEVVVGTQRTGTLSVHNRGRGDLKIDGLTLDGSADFSLLTDAPLTVAPGDSADLSIRYTPDAIGPDDGTALISSNDPDSPLVSLPLLGQGVEPTIDVDPVTLWFGSVEVGDSNTLTADINARGQGTLRITDIGFSSDEAEAFSFSLPDGLSAPTALAAGTGLTVSVTFTPTDDRAWDGALYIRSNDPNNAEVDIRLLANTDGTGTEAPTVEITSPDWGNYLVYGTAQTLTGVVVDDADAPTNLIALWYANDTLLGSSTPDASGQVTLGTSALPEGDVTIRLTAVDTSSLTGSDDVDVSVYDPEEPTPYLLTGGSSIWDYWSVDDDIVITLDGAEVFRDVDHTSDAHPPVDIEASAGQTLQIVATDYNYCDQALDALTLHWGTGASQALNAAWCRSACPDHACYDPDFVGPWPGVFFDQSYVISVP